MEKNVFDYLKSKNIEFKEYKHKAVFTVEEHKLMASDISGMHTKSLFLKDESNNFYLVCMNAYKRLNINSLQKHLSVKKLRFANPEELKNELNLTPGSVSIFGMINANQKIHLIIDKEVFDAEETGFHPNINTSTLVINHKSLEIFLKTIPNKTEVLLLE